ncbi:MAG: permease, partial [Mangrovicoccus sp.]
SDPTPSDSEIQDPPPAPKRPALDMGFAIVIAVALASGIGVWITKGPERFLEILLYDLGFTAALLPKILGGILLASVIGVMLPRDKVLKLVGPDSGVKGLALAMIAGAVIPGGPSATYPLVIGLMAAGADMGAGIALVTGWVLLSVNRTVIWELSFLPADFVGLRILVTLPFPILIGLAARKLQLRWSPPR